MTLDSQPEDLTALGEISADEEGDPFKVLIATLLSHRTRDENTTKAVDQLFSVYKNPKDVASASEEELQKLIRPVGFYRNKARTIKRVADMVLAKHEGRVPDKINDLLALPGVGRKTANCVLVYGFGKPAIPVDTHVHRISNRIGLVETRTPEETEAQLTRLVDEKFWLDINELFVKFGQRICKPIGPKCPVCMLKRICKYYKKYGADRRR